MCGESLKWKKVDSTNKGFSVGKAAVGGILFGAIGLVGGALGKKKSAIIVETVILHMNMTDKEVL